MNNSENKIRVCAVVPFFNEEQFIGSVISKTQSYVDFIVAVNDGSTDNSYNQIKDIKNLEVITLDRNYGKGFALQKGFEYCLDREFDIVVTLDADNQHDPKFIPELLDKLKFFDIVIGNRLDDLKNMPVHRRLSNKITSLLLTLRTGQKISDSQCGYRAYKKRVIEKCKTISNGFEAESEILILASRAGFKIGFTKIDTVYGAEKSKMKSFSAIKGFIKIFFAT